MTDKTLRSANGARRRQQQQPHRRPSGPVLMQDIWLMEKLAHFDRERIPSGWCTPKARAPTAPSP
jgi:catalase